MRRAAPALLLLILLPACAGRNLDVAAAAERTLSVSSSLYNHISDEVRTANEEGRISEELFEDLAVKLEKYATLHNASLDAVQLYLRTGDAAHQGQANQIYAQAAQLLLDINELFKAWQLEQLQ